MIHAARPAALEKWVAHEFQVLGRLWRAGVPVPKPVAFDGFTLLMEYIGDEEASAPHLRNVDFDKSTGEVVLAEILERIESMLAANLIHGDLSPYNILFWQGQPVFIDVPQALDPRLHPMAREVLERDVLRATDWANDLGIEVDGRDLAATLWQRWWMGELV